ncbi:glycosyltransferase [Salipaludibacillus sp. HK11]|uniref:glycosyltransferase n=1 Tax=Salipaludibacillus sp. HK11 TaxID=3394320 RepID=UPI0039FC7420
MREELISVICTVKNGETTIKETILSVINQTYTKLEFIIVDDGSIDSTKKIIGKLARLDKRIKPIYTNGIGRGNALNLAVQKSNGGLIANIDADDLMHPKRLRIQLDKFIENEGIFIVCSNSVIIYNSEPVLWEEGDTVGDKVITDNLLIKNRINHTSVMFNKKLLIEVGCYNQSLKSQFDYELWLRALAKKKIMLIIPNKLVAKRIHKNQSFENKKRVRYLIRSQKLQIKYALVMRKRIFMVIMIAPLRIALGILPFKIRRKLILIFKHIGFN